MVRALDDVSAVVLSVDVRGHTLARMDLYTKDAAGARRLAAAVERNVAFARQMFAQNRKRLSAQMPPKLPRSILAVAERALEGISVRKDSGRVAVAAIRPEGLDEAVKALAPVLVAWQKSAKKGGEPGPVADKDYSFSVPTLRMEVKVLPDASVLITYDIAFQTNEGARPIDVVDIGVPHKGYRLNDITASIDGKPLRDIRPSTMVSPGFEVHLGESRIPPGRSGKFHVEFGMPDMVSLNGKHHGGHGVLAVVFVVWPRLVLAVGNRSLFSVCPSIARHGGQRDRALPYLRPVVPVGLPAAPNWQAPTSNGPAAARGSLWHGWTYCSVGVRSKSPTLPAATPLPMHGEPARKW